jgi:proton-translocating NAD(P)+ transhydrogenase subunit alpha
VGRVKIGVVKEVTPGEARVAVIPETVKRLGGKKIGAIVQAGAGAAVGARDEDYKQAGAEIAATAAEVYRNADVVVKIHAPTPAEIPLLTEGKTLISLLYPLVNRDLVIALAARKITILSTDSIPRTTLAQMMDVLSSQATVAGYRAVILAAHAVNRLFPMLMTAAGTLAPAKVLILGAGVAGLQAIATARRLGAVVEAFDVRKVVKEQVESLGARFIEVPSEEDAQTASGYAKELSEEYKKKQSALIGDSLARCDACITTALIPGRRAPILVTAEQVGRMKAGSVIVDMAAEQGGNCELTKPGERVVTKGGAIILGEVNLPSQMAVHASQMFSRNMEKLLLHLSKDGELKLDPNEEIIRGMMVARAGDVIAEKVGDKPGPTADKPAAPSAAATPAPKPAAEKVRQP